MNTIEFKFVLDTGDGDYYFLDAKDMDEAQSLISMAEDSFGFSFGEPKIVDAPDNATAVYNALTKTSYKSLGYNDKESLFDAYDKVPEFADSHAYSIDNVESAVIGVTEDGSRFIYDYNLILEALQTNDGMTYEEAVEWYSYNIERSFPYYQPCPIVVTSVCD